MILSPRYAHNKEKFEQKVKECIDTCKEEIMNPDLSDPHSVK